MLGQALGLVVLATGHVIGIIPSGFYLFFVAAIAMLSPGLSLRSRLALMLVLPTMHICWGVGFWVGVIRGANMGTVDKSRISSAR